MATPESAEHLTDQSSEVHQEDHLGLSALDHLVVITSSASEVVHHTNHNQQPDGRTLEQIISGGGHQHQHHQQPIVLSMALPAEVSSAQQHHGTTLLSQGHDHLTGGHQLVDGSTGATLATITGRHQPGTTTQTQILVAMPMSGDAGNAELLIKEEPLLNEQLFPMTVVTTSTILDSITSSSSSVVAPVVASAPSASISTSIVIPSTSAAAAVATSLSSTASAPPQPLQPTRKSTRLSTKTTKNYALVDELFEVELDPSTVRRQSATSFADELEEEEYTGEVEDGGDLEEDDDLDDELIDLEFDDADEDDVDLGEEEDDEYRPLKKRKLNRSAAASTSTPSTRKLNNKNTKRNTTITTRSRNGELLTQSELNRLRSRLQVYQRHRSSTNSLLDVMTSLNAALMSRLYRELGGRVETTELTVTLVNLIELLPAEDPLAGQLSALHEQLNQLVEGKTALDVELGTEVEDLEEAEVQVPNGGTNKSGVKRSRSSRPPQPAKAPVSTASTMATKSKPKQSTSTTSTSSKRKRTRRPTAKMESSREGGRLTENLDDQTTKMSPYHSCPWPNCTYESKREWALNEHINLTHTGLKQFGCKVDGCPATFFGSSELDNHMKKYHADVASKEFMPCTWPGCNALFKSKLGLRAHLQVHKGENLIQCDWPGCNYYAKNRRQSENHLRKHTGDRPFACDYPGCDSKFRTNDSLRHHKKSHSEYRPFRCDWPGCEANFKTNRGLTIHRALHTGEKLFKCDWADCEFASERKYHVDLHIFQTHTHVKPYPCTWAGCDASFLRNDKLQNHLKIHRQEKPFKCIHPACDKHFVEKGNMMKHYNNVHKR